MIVVIRISGLVEIPPKEKATLDRIRLRKKYSAILLKETPENMSLLQSIRSFIAYGKIDAKTLESLISKRGKSLDDKKIDTKKAAELIEEGKIKEAGIKPFFRLHPPRGGIDSKDHYPKGVLGDNKEDINELIRRML